MNQSHPPIPSEPLPVLYRQSWVMVLATGQVLEAGASYHLRLEDVGHFVSDYLSTESPLDSQGHEEPLGDPIALHTTQDFYRRVRETAHGIRSR